VEITDKRSQTVMDAFHNNLLRRYTRPAQVTFDNGSESKSVFKEMCDNLGIKYSPTPSYTPQGKSIIERIHQVMGNMLRAFELVERELVPDGIRSTLHTTLQAIPGQLVFGRDMIHHVRFQANWDRIKNNIQKIIENSNKREDINRIKRKYNVGDRIIL
jgi:transposase InsO family protein